MRILITGARGFVASHLYGALVHVCGGDIEMIATAKEPGPHPIFGKVTALDVTNHTAVEAALQSHAPTHVLHLAGIAGPSAANTDPHMAWRVHLCGALNFARAILARRPDCWLLHAGSALVYGDSARSGFPLDESALLAPMDDYAASKAAADLALGALAHRGLKCVRFRPFNHSGPGQAKGFVVPDFAMQIAKIEAGVIPPLMRVGDLNVERDFLDVRDVVRAYALATRDAVSLAPGVIFNIASGVPRRIGDVLECLLQHSHVNISIEQDPARLRSTDLPRMIGNAAHARACLAWSPEYRFEDTVADVLNDWRRRIVS